MCRKIRPERGKVESLFDIFRRLLQVYSCLMLIRKGERRKPRSRKERRENNSE